jgi:hypothetical protein
MHVFAKIPIIDAAFQKVSNFKLPRVSGWRKPFIEVPSKLAPMIACFLSGSTWSTMTGTS